MRTLGYLITNKVGAKFYDDRPSDPKLLSETDVVTELVAKPVPLSDDEMRAKFEAWYSNNGRLPSLVVKNEKGFYHDKEARISWLGCQAAYESMNEDK